MLRFSFIQFMILQTFTVVHSELCDTTQIQDTLTRFQSQIQELQGKVNTQQNTINAYQATINAQQSTITSQQTVISNLQSTLTSGHSDNSSMASTVADLKSKITSDQSSINAMNATISSLKSIVTSDQQLIAQLQAKESGFQLAITDLVNKVGSGHIGGPGGATTFVRWGRKDCPGNFSLVYSGYAGGSFFTDKGAAAEYVCMPPDPQWGPNRFKIERYAGFIYGAEYENPDVFQMKDYLQDVPCAVCETSSHSMTLMIPGRTACYGDWTEAYHGDLASGNHEDAAASQYVCVDQNPQALQFGATKDDNGKLFHAVQAKCNPLRCPPYEDNKLLSCVVCVK